MLQKSRRIPTSFFLKHNKECKLFHSVLFSTRVYTNNLNINRASVVVSKKVVINAVKRNNIRRMLYNILRDKLKEIDKEVNKNYDFVIYIKKTKQDVSYDDFKKEINKLFKIFK